MGGTLVKCCSVFLQTCCRCSDPNHERFCLDSGTVDVVVEPDTYVYLVFEIRDVDCRNLISQADRDIGVNVSLLKVDYSAPVLDSDCECQLEVFMAKREKMPSRFRKVWQVEFPLPMISASPIQETAPADAPKDEKDEKDRDQKDQKEQKEPAVLPTPRGIRSHQFRMTRIETEGFSAAHYFVTVSSCHRPVVVRFSACLIESETHKYVVQNNPEELARKEAQAEEARHRAILDAQLAEIEKKAALERQRQAQEEAERLAREVRIREAAERQVALQAEMQRAAEEAALIRAQEAEEAEEARRRAEAQQLEYEQLVRQQERLRNTIRPKDSFDHLVQQRVAQLVDVAHHTAQSLNTHTLSHEVAPAQAPSPLAPIPLPVTPLPPPPASFPVYNPLVTSTDPHHFVLAEVPVSPVHNNNTSHNPGAVMSEDFEI
eukprot:TRINITY_DN2333_c0_g1_i4.p1 TRINITY_DN2333_c0_g1~~TRINITY_DN2333_c0_g1_i4.p1  ORF type:complete len:432 (-),score=35.91 TRINITY_DN2333_c0_g1_i4:437-1732(-)